MAVAPRGHVNPPSPRTSSTVKARRQRRPRRPPPPPLPHPQSKRRWKGGTLFFSFHFFSIPPVWLSCTREEFTWRGHAWNKSILYRMFLTTYSSIAWCVCCPSLRFIYPAVSLFPLTSQWQVIDFFPFFFSLFLSRCRMTIRAKARKRGGVKKVIYAFVIFKPRSFDSLSHITHNTVKEERNLWSFFLLYRVYLIFLFHSCYEISYKKLSPVRTALHLRCSLENNVLLFAISLVSAAAAAAAPFRYFIISLWDSSRSSNITRGEKKIPQRWYKNGKKILFGSYRPISFFALFRFPSFFFFFFFKIQIGWPIKSKALFIRNWIMALDMPNVMCTVLAQRTPNVSLPWFLFGSFGALLPSGSLLYVLFFLLRRFVFCFFFLRERRHSILFSYYITFSRWWGLHTFSLFSSSFRWAYAQIFVRCWFFIQ